MNNTIKTIAVTVLTAGLAAGCASNSGSGTGIIPERERNLAQDYRSFHAGGEIKTGQIGDSYASDLVMYIAGDQFMVMKALLSDFQDKNPDIKTIYVETIPAGEIMESQILVQGEVNKQKTNQIPDLYASVNIQHLNILKQNKLMDKYIIYAHNKLELMVAKSNPKNITSLKDLSRDELVQSHPNPLTEGIFEFYATTMLKKAHLYDKVTGEEKCAKCWAVPGKTWFTARHYRETPLRIENGEADVGIVWSTEVKFAVEEGRNVEGVAIAAPLNQEQKVSYAIGPMIGAKNMENAMRYLKYLATDDAQEIYTNFGFGKATSDELQIKNL